MALPTSGVCFAKVTFVELRLRLRMLAAFAGSGPGTAAVATATWSAHLLDLQRGGLPPLWCPAVPANNFNFSNVKNFASLPPPPHYFLAGVVLYSCFVSIQS